MASKKPDVSFSHFGMWVENLPRMVRFYTGLLGYVVSDRGPLNTPTGRHPFAFLTRDAAEHHQLVLAGGRPANLAFNPINQLSFRVDSLATLRAYYARVTSKPYAALVSDIHPVCHGNALSLYFRDPEGNRIELYIDTPWYVNQPMRLILDFSLSDAALWAWVKNAMQAKPGFQPVEHWRRNLQRELNAANLKLKRELAAALAGARRKAGAAKNSAAKKSAAKATARNAR
jgi:catechol 2,3-dioxygenase-like lactoylglutathione lyase family enzyme